MSDHDTQLDYLVKKLKIPREEARRLLTNMEAEHGD